jgi:heterodisulfide reductase subunit A-like polyferredoxin
MVEVKGLLVQSSVLLYQMEQSPKVVVIGGGVAGLTAAYRL